MSSVRRSKTMPTDGPTAKFLYTILKQLDLKSIDWNLVASQLEISNGHAARMRFSRFKQQMEGTTSTPRSSRPKKNTKGSSSSDKNPKADIQKTPISPPPAPSVKQETPYDPQQSPYIKIDPYVQRIPTLENISHNISSMFPESSQSLETSPMYHHPHHHRVPQSQLQHFPFNPYHPHPHPQYHQHMTVAPVDMAMSAAVSPFSPVHLGFELPPADYPVWAPVKHEPEDGGGLGLLVKTEVSPEK